MSEDLTIYHFPLSSCSRKVIFVLEHKKIHYKEKIIDLSLMEQKTEAFLRINPYGQVPVLKSKDEFIYESSIINNFLEEKFSDISLLPISPLKRAKVQLSIHYADNFFYPHISRLLAEFRKENKRDNNIINKLLEEFKLSHLSFLEKQLGDSNSFIFGDLSLADIAYAPGLTRLLEVSSLDISEHPKILKWLDLLYELEAFKKITLYNNKKIIGIVDDKNKTNLVG